MRTVSLFPPAFLLLAAPLVACNNGTKAQTDDTSVGQDADTDTDTDADADTDSDADTDTGCAATIVSTTPNDGATDVMLDTTVTATFSDAAYSAELVLKDSTGASVPGRASVGGDGLSVTFTPDDLLARSATYTYTVRACGQNADVSFTTVGDAVTTDLTGRTYDVDLAGSDITWLAPNAGPTLVSSLTTDHLLLMVQSVGSQIDTLAAAGLMLDRGLTQYPCADPIDFPATSFASDPAFLAGPLDAELSAGSTSVPVYDLTFGGTFSADGNELGGVEVTGLIDARPITDSLGTDVCAVLPMFGDSCIACPDGVVQCIALDVLDAAAPYASGVTVDPDPTCGGS